MAYSEDIQTKKIIMQERNTYQSYFIEKDPHFVICNLYAMSLYFHDYLFLISISLLVLPIKL